MVLQAGKIIERMEGTLGGPLRSDLDPYELLNDAGHHLVNVYPWKWLERQEALLDIVQGQPYAKLPNGVREIIAYDAAESLVNSLYLTSFSHLLKLRTYQVDEQSFHFFGALENAAPVRKNLLLHTEDFANAAWEKLFTATVAANQLANPIDGKVTADKVTDDDTGQVERLRQVVPMTDLADGDYTFSVYMKEDPADLPLSRESAIHLYEGFDVGDPNTEAIINWAASPPTITVATGVNRSKNPGTVKITEVGDGWVRAEANLTYVKKKAASHLTVEIYPAYQLAADVATDTGSVFVWGAQLERVGDKIAGGAAGTALVATEYEAVFGSRSPAGGPPRLQLALWPVPTVSESGKLAIFYRGEWSEVYQDDDYVTLPSWLRGLYLEYTMAFARGWEEEDAASISARLAEIENGPLYHAAIERDSTTQPNYGVLMGGAAETGLSVIDWGLHTIVPDP